MDYKTTINNLFSPRKHLFAVPNYQRAFTWERDKQITQFISDLEEHPVSVTQYNLGHFLFEYDSSNNNKYWVIDGQQRLTSAIILLACIYRKLKDISEYNTVSQNLFNEYLRNTDGEQKFKTVDYDNNFFENMIIDERADIIDTMSRRRILEAKDFFTKKVNAAPIDAVLRWKDLIENARITTDQVTDKAEATQLFTFQNDRGKDLSNLEKLKAYLMFNIYLSCRSVNQNPNDAIAFIEKEFEIIYKTIESISIADEDQVLNYHTIAFLTPNETSLERVKRALNRTTDKQKWIKDFAIALKNSFETVKHIQTLRDKNSYVADLLYLDSSNSFPLLLKLYHYNSDHQHLELVMHMMEITLFRMTYTVGSYRTNSFPNMASSYTGKMEPLIGEMIEVARHGFQPYWNFESDFHRFLDGDNHYYKSTRYLLWKYENHLRSEVKEQYMSCADFQNLYGKHNLENTLDHWSPQNPNKEYEQEFKDKYLNNLGNLVLATRGRNSSDSNNMPDQRSIVSTLIQRQKLETIRGVWDASRIKERQAEIVAFAKNNWDPIEVIKSIGAK